MQAAGFKFGKPTVQKFGVRATGDSVFDAVVGYARATKRMSRNRSRSHGRDSLGARSILWGMLAWMCALLMASVAGAAPEAHLLRIDPRSSTEDNAPVLTTVIELLQQKPLSDLSAQCAHLKGNSALSCLADRLDKSRALYAPFKFPRDNAKFLVTVDERDLPSELLSIQKWGKSKAQKGVGTAWLIMIDASGQMGARFPEAKTVAKAFVSRMGPNDIVDVMFFNDQSIVKHSKWKAKKGASTRFIDSVGSTYPKQGRTKTLFSIVQKGVTDGFLSLGNVGKGINVPLHQAMVLLSDANAGTDLNSAAVGALKLRTYLTKGRFPEDNTTQPKMPLPVVTVWFPQRARDEEFANARQFMENLANPEIGGAFFIVMPGQSKGNSIARSVMERFDLMNIVKWKVPCLQPTVTQNFQLVFKDFEQPIKGDACNECPLGQDPKLWPIDIDYQATEAYAKKNKLFPGGTVKVFGNFCWGADIERAEIYMLPRNQPPPKSLEGKSLEEAQKARNALIRSNMRGKSINGGDSFVEFDLPETAKWLKGKDKKLTARLIIFDSRAGRTSPITVDKIITLKAQQKPMDYLLIGGATFGGLVILLLLINLLVGGGRSRRRAAGAKPRPIVATPGRAMAAAPGQAMPPAPGQAMAGPMPAARAPDALAPHAVVAAPAASPAATAARFPSPGPGFPDPFQAGMPGANAGGAMPADAAFGASGTATRASLHGNPGIYPLAEGAELKVGRDPGLCDICLTEPRISGMHATVKFDNGQVFIRDEGSNNGTYVNLGKIQSYAWVSVPPGGTLRFGPIEFTVRFE